MDRDAVFYITGLVVGAVLAWLILTTPARADVAVGDSFTAPTKAWCHQLQLQGHHYKCLAQSIRFGATYTTPPDLTSIDGHDYLVHWLGTNDALLWTEPGFPAQYGAAFQATMMAALNSGYDGVLLVLPPTMPDRDTSGVRYYQTLWYVIATAYFGRDDVRLLDPDDHDFINNLDATAHPTATWQLYWAGVVHQTLQDWRNE